jgi:uncharacterized protein (DUF2267 family)
MAVRIEEYVLKGREFMGYVAEALQRPDDLDHASQVTVSVLHALRDRLTPEESLHFISQLPIYIKAVYADGWHYDENKRSQNTKDPDPREAEAVFSVLKKYVSAGEMQRALSQFPAIELSNPKQ